MTANQSTAAVAPRDPILSVAIETGAIPPAPAKPARQKLSVRDVARLWGVSQARVRKWIFSGELRAMVASVKANSKRPQFLIDVSALKEFEDRREAATFNFIPEKPVRRGSRKKRHVDSQVIEFF